MTTVIAPGVLIVETSVADGRIGVIAGDRVALAVDAGIDDAEGAAVMAAARSLGRHEIRLVYTHGHVDHALGGTVFRGHDIIANVAVRDHMVDQLDAWAERTDEQPDELRARLGWPTTMLDTGGKLDLGGRRVHLVTTPGHAPGALCVYDPDAGVLFGGDTVVTGIPPVFRDGDSATLESTLRDLARLEIEILVPGHGDVVRGVAASREAILWAADYIGRCRAHVAERSGDDADAVVRAASFEAFIGERLPRDRHRMEWRHEQTFRTLLAEIAGGD